MTQQWKPVEEQSWAMTRKSIAEDGDIGAKFLVFLNFWLNTAEKMMAEGNVATETQHPDGSITGEIGVLSSANAVRRALEVAEARLGFIDVHFMGQLLVVIGTYWAHGEAFCREMSPIELKITGEALRIKLDDMARQAEVVDDGLDRSSGVAGDPQMEAESLQESIDPLNEPDGRDDPGPGAVSGGLASHLRAAEPGAHGQALQRAQVRRRAARQRSEDAARQDQSGEVDDEAGGEG